MSSWTLAYEHIANKHYKGRHLIDLRRLTNLVTLYRK